MNISLHTQASVHTVTVKSLDHVAAEADDALFTYTSGRWLYNERPRLQERYLRFNVPQLVRIAVLSCGRTEADVVNLRKLAEGGFNRVFELTMRDGLQVIARLPYPSTIPKHYTIASEVATMDFVRLHGVPVPKIYTYAATSQNPVGSEYIIMEKVAGKDLGEVWFDMTSKQRLELVTQVVDMETLLFSLDLPANGSIFYKRDLPIELESVEIPGTGELDGFCIGPDVQLRWWYQERAQLPIYRRPYLDSEGVLQAAGKKELAWMRHYARPRYPYAPLYREVYGLQKVSPSDHIRSLSEYLQIAKYIRPKESRMNRPVLRHPDLQRNNILVSDSLEIRGIIDWQHCTILPLFLHAWIPTDFQNYGDIDSLQLAKPQLPENYDQLDPEQQDEARELYRRRQLHFFYMGYTAEINEHHYDAMNLNQIVLRQQLFRHAASPWEGDNVRLKTDLIRATQAWRELATTEDGHIPECPLSYSEAEVERCLQQWSEQHDADKNTETVRRTLGINIDGWVPLEGYDWAKQLNQALKAQAIEWAETELERGELQNHWPFDDHDEDGQD